MVNTNLLEDLGQLVSFPSITREKAEHDLLNWLFNHVSQFQGDFNGTKISVQQHTDSGLEISHGFIVVDIDVEVSNGTNKIALLGHIDVVPIKLSSWTTDPFRLEQRDNRLFGRGVCDMKSGVVIMIDMIRRSTTTKPKKSFKCIFTTGEEKGEPNGLSLCIKEKGMDDVGFAIALEPTEGFINLGIFGYYFGNFHFEGKSCHSAKPEEGENAIYKAGKLIALLNEKKWKYDTIDFGDTTNSEVLEATMISGGEGGNIIPGKSHVGVNYRYIPGKSKELVEIYMSQLAEKVGAKIELIENNAASHLVDRNHSEVQDLAKSTNKKTGMNLAKFWSDISQSSLYGIPSVNFGPGSIKQAHTDNEYIQIGELERVHSAYINYLF